MKKKYFSILFLVLIYLATFLTTEQSINVMKNIFLSDNIKKNDNQMVIIIDAGHGGWDPGKIGVNNALEKDINLSIAIKLKNLLEQNDIKVVMTREDEKGLYSETSRNKKKDDMNKRLEIIKNSGADLAISIHQNSFTEEYVKGAQVFYYGSSLEGKELAEITQEQLKKTIADGNHRLAKANNNYFLLKNSPCTMVIVECGFISNQKEAALLLQDDYQEKMAWGIHLAIMRYINEKKLNSSAP